MTAVARDDYDAMSDAEFRTMVRDFIEAECPPEIRHLPRRMSLPDLGKDTAT